MIVPPFLKTGDCIGISATARKVNNEEISAGIKAMEQAGFKVILASNVFKSQNQYSGTDEERAEGFNELLCNPKVKAIWNARGGYGSVRLIDKIDWATFKQNPKWLCGFSDVTALHAHLQQKLKISSIHSEMLLGYQNNSPQSHQSLINCLMGKENTFKFKSHDLNRNGSSIGEIVGGNLSVLYSLLGSESQLETDGKILFIEDLDEYLYHIDRMMMALKRAGMLMNLKALVVGGMSDMNDNAIPFGKSAEEIILDVASDYDYPLCFGFPAGHLKDNRGIALGFESRIEIAEKVIFTQAF